MMKESSAVLHPVAFGGQRCCGNKIRLHSHLGKGFAGDWAINKNRHMLLGTQFVWATDCYAVRFILSSDRNNPAVLWLQMRLMCWDVDIVHQNNTHLTDVDYWLHLGKDICFDLHFREYLQFDCSCVWHFPHQLPYPCFHRTCHTIVVHVFLHKTTPQFKMQMQPTAKPLSPPSQAVKLLVLHTYLTFLFGSVTSTQLLWLMHMFQQTTKFHIWPSRSCDSVGQYTPLMEGILAQQFLLTIFLFV